VFVLYLGPKWMTNRPTFNLKQILLFYNILMSTLNAFLFAAMMAHYKLLYQFLIDFHYPDITNQSEPIMSFIPYVYLFIFSKFIDFFDTIFFILRRKWS